MNRAPARQTNSEHPHRTGSGPSRDDGRGVRPWSREGGHVTAADGRYVGYLQDFSELASDEVLQSVNACAVSVPLPPVHLHRLRALARGFVTAKHGRDLAIHNLNTEGIAYQAPGRVEGSSSVASWWEVLVYAQTGEVPR